MLDQAQIELASIQDDERTGKLPGIKYGRANGIYPSTGM
jgi:hypothetical protein